METENRGLDLEKELTCSICTEVLYQPLTLLDCLHTFCGSCLKEWFSWQLTASRNSPNSLPTGSTPYTCPSCRAPVRDTKHNATVTTLLDMFVAANPDKDKTAEEKEDMRKKYKPGDEVLPKLEAREKTLRERRVEDEDRRLMNEVRDLSLREVGVESSEDRRERRRREGSRSHHSRSQTSRESSRDTRPEGRERRRRREWESEGRRARDDINLRAEVPLTEDRRRRRSDEEARRRHDETHRTSARQIEHQSSLRSLISSSDFDSREMEEEILRQIREEGLLNGIDLDNLDLNQEDQITERIAEAFRRRQSERPRQEPARRSDASGQRPRNQSSAPVSRETSGDEGVRATTRRRRHHSRSTSAVSQGDEQSRPPPSMSAIHAAHLDVHSSDEGRRRRRTTSSGRSATSPIPVAEVEARPAARSQTDLSNRPQSSYINTSRPSVTANSRSTTDPTAPRAIELPTSEPVARVSPVHTPKSSPRIFSTAQIQELPASIPKTRAPPPADIFVPSSIPSAASSGAVDRNLVPAPLSSPRISDTSKMSLSDRAVAISSGSRPTSASSPTARSRPMLYHEPLVTCARCAKPHIEYELHYNCGTCEKGDYNICLSCYRSGAGCLHWFGFVATEAWRKLERLKAEGEQPPDAEAPHMLKASRYVPPKTPAGGADGRRTLTMDDPEKRLQSGVFCANCLAWANECYWRCESCNQGEWGFCNNCVNQGKSCTHPLLPLTYKPIESALPPLSPTHDHQIPSSARILTGPGITGIGNFKPLTFTTTCDKCCAPIEPYEKRYHCFSCVSRVLLNTPPGAYDICMTCYSNLVNTSCRISQENGHNGWRRCPQGHRMIIAGFEGTRNGQVRVVLQDLVGGRGLAQKPSPIKDHNGGKCEEWSWGDGAYDSAHKKLVTTNVMNKAPINPPDMVIERGFPPDGGVGLRAVAGWGWYPAEGDEDELMFPRGAEIRECKDIGEEWFHGTYMGKRGIFPAPYVTIQNSGVRK